VRVGRDLRPRDGAQVIARVPGARPPGRDGVRVQELDLEPCVVHGAEP
jgi:hypothetical protein